MRGHYVLRALKFVMFAVLFVVGFGVLGFVVEGLWNWLMPALFGWKLIGYWQALGLIILSKILFGGFRGSGGRAGWYRHPRGTERWKQMTPEEREKFRQRLRDCWNRFAAPNSSASA